MSNIMDKLSAPRVSDPNVSEEREVEVSNLRIERGPYRRVANTKIRKLQSPPLHVAPVTCGSRLPEVRRHSSYLEFFSIYVAGTESKNLRVYGTVHLPYKSDEPLYIRTRVEAEAVAPYEPISTVSCGAISGLEMSVALKDEVGDADLSRGMVGFGPQGLERKFDRRLCSIVRGPRGYAAVHYSAFSEALRATIWVKILPETGDAVRGVFGHLTAHYGLYYYGTDYAKAFYTMGLFDRAEEDMAHVTVDGIVPLLKPLVVVPVDTSLVVWGCLLWGENRQSIPISVEMWPQCDRTTKSVRLRGENCSVEVGVEWRD